MRLIAAISMLAAALVATLAPAPAGAQQEAESGPIASTVEPPIIIDSEANHYDLRSGVTRFSGNVTIQRGPMRVSADEGVIHQGDGRITLIELYGSPTTWRDRLDDGTEVEGEAAQIEYKVIDNIITLTGNARLRHEQGEFSGDQLVYNLDTKRLDGRGSDGKRARVVLESDAVDDSTQRDGDDDSDPPPDADDGQSSKPPEPR